MWMKSSLFSGLFSACGEQLHMALNKEPEAGNRPPVGNDLSYSTGVDGLLYSPASCSLSWRS
jgi:hypothetical protein